MIPNIFAEASNCDEDRFSHALAYVLDLAPSIGTALGSRFAMLAGLPSSHFGAFESCEFVACEYLGSHRASRPDLVLSFSTRILYLENKLESPLNLRQMRNHALLASEHAGRANLAFVSNRYHHNAALYSLPHYIHPTGRTHYLWAGLLSSMKPRPHSRGAERRLVQDFLAAARFYGMLGRTLVGAGDNLYARGSQACALGLQQLAMRLTEVGFRVHRRAHTESTLRVYHSAEKLPLLNPRFEPTAHWLHPKLDCETLVITVLSRGHNGFHNHLSRFPSTPACRYIAAPSIDRDGYHYHGNFALPVSFTPVGASSRIDFDLLRPSLAKILDHLRSAS